MTSSKTKPFNPIKSFLTSVKELFAFSKKICYNNYRKCKKERMGNMDLYQLLTAEERGIITEYIEGYAPQNRLETPLAPLEEILYYWNEAKSEHLNRIFNGKLILERDLEYDAPITDLVNRYNTEYMKHHVPAEKHFYNNLYKLFWGHEEFAQFRYDRRTHSGCTFSESTYNYLATPSTLLKNVWELPETTFPLPNGRTYKVYPGTKVARILGKLAKEWNVEGWEKVREAQAKAMTTKRTKGTLCLSIHPLDYMSMSDNCEGWHSCMSWFDRREYRAGTVEMMNSPCVVVAYIKHPTHKLEFDAGSWNSKIWRELFIVDPRIITNIKAYPTENPWLSKYISTWLKELTEEAGVSEYHDKCICYGSNDEHSDAWIKQHDVQINFRTGVMYNDCGRVDQYMYLQKRNNYHFNVYYSGERTCMICGRTESETTFIQENQVACEECDYVERFYCEECGEIIYNAEDVYTIGDHCFCYACWNELGTVPYDGDEMQFVEDLTKVYLRLPDGTLSEEYMYICDEYHFIHHHLNDELDPDEGLPYDKIHHCHWIPYHLADERMKFEFGLTKREQLKYDYWDVDPVVRDKAIENYMNRQYASLEDTFNGLLWE